MKLFKRKGEFDDEPGPVVQRARESAYKVQANIRYDESRDGGKEWFLTVVYVWLFLHFIVAAFEQGPVKAVSLIFVVASVPLYHRYQKRKYMKHHET